MRCKIHPDGQDIFVEVDWMTGHRMEETAQNLVIRAFGRHGITLHIDDGCMGGGGSIGWNDNGFITSAEESSLYDSKGYDRTGSFCFKPEHKGVFRYCILAEDTDGTAHGSAPGDDFTIGVKHFQSTLSFVHTFMHELGHNILGVLDINHQSLPDSWQHIYLSRWSDCVMYESNTGGGNDGDVNNLGYSSKDKYYNYRDELWAEIERDGLLGL